MTQDFAEGASRSQGSARVVLVAAPAPDLTSEPDRLLPRVVRALSFPLSAPALSSLDSNCTYLC